MFNRESRQRHALFIRNNIQSITLTLSSKVLDAKVVGDPVLVAKLEKLTDDAVGILDYLNTHLDSKET